MEKFVFTFKVLGTADFHGKSFLEFDKHGKKFLE